MGLTLDNLAVQPLATGSFNGTSGPASLPTGTEAGSQVLIVAGILGDGSGATTLDTPSGFTAIQTAAASTDYARLFAWVKASASAGETSWTLSLSTGSHRVVWAVLECTGLDLDWTDKAYLLAAEASGVSTTVTEKTTANSALSESFSAVTLVAVMATATDTTTPTVDGWSDLFFESGTVTGSDGSRACRMSLAQRHELNIGTPNTTVDISPGSYAATLLLTFTGVDSLHAPTVLAMSGAEIGTATSITSGGGTIDGDTPPWDGSAGSPAVVSTSPRSGTFAYELSSSAAAENLTWTTGAGNNLQDATIDVLVARLNVYFPTSLPSGDVDLASIEAGSLANGVVLRYVSASQKLGVKIGSGSEQLSDATVTAGQWIGVDLRYDPRTSTHTCDWQVDYNSTPGDATGPVGQTAASTTGMTGAAVSTFRIGWTGSTTATVRYDDILVSRNRKAYPLGDIEIRPLKVDPGGTPTVSGSSANFRTWTSNGTLASWTAAATITALDDIPPTIGAGSDGLAQIANASTEYVEVPMETFALGPDYSAVAGRWYLAPWAASANPATIRFQPHDGSGTFSPVGDTLDAGADDTALTWRTKMHNTSSQLNTFYQLSQAKLDALAVRLGYGIDQNPDAGWHTVLFELAVKPAVVYGVTSAEGGAFTVYLRQDPFAGAHISYLVTTPSGSRGATAYGTVGGTPWSQHVDPNTTFEKTVNATSVADVTEGPGLTPDPPS